MIRNMRSSSKIGLHLRGVALPEKKSNLMQEGLEEPI